MNKNIYIAGGCFWGVEAYFSYVNGITKSRVGYANSKIENPTYEMVCSGNTNAVECVELLYEPSLISIDNILDHFFDIIDPTTLNKQGNDIGTQYRTGIYFIDGNDETIIKTYINAIKNRYSSDIVTEVLKLTNFYPAEEYHQQYLKKNPNGYCHVDLSKFI